MADLSRAELKYFVERQREEIKTLNEVGKLLCSTTDPQELIRLATSYLQQAFPIALCSILYLPERKLHLRPFAPIGQVETATALRQMREAAGKLLGRTLTEQESALEESQPQTWLQPTTVLRSQLFCPMTDKGHPIGLLCVFSGKSNAFTNEDQQAVGIVAEQLGAALRNAFLVEELRRADELKNQLLAIVSHELSTPLTAIKEGVNLILDGALGETTADQKDFLGTVNENAERLDRLIRKIKIATEVMTGQTRFKREPVDLCDVLAKLDKSYRPQAESRDVNVKLIQPAKPLNWTVDRLHVVTAIGEIWENAIQATPADGFVTVRLSSSESEVEVQVTDTGSGIAKETLPILFDRFKSIGDINNRKMGGLGLGLFIAKALIEGQGGKLQVESELGEGTRMSICLPKAAAAET